MNDTIHILIADDHAIVREGLRWLIATEPGMELVGEVADASKRWRKRASCTPTSS